MCVLCVFFDGSMVVVFFGVDTELYEDLSIISFYSKHRFEGFHGDL